MKALMIFFNRKEEYDGWKHVDSCKEYDYVFSILANQSERITQFSIGAYEEESNHICYEKLVSVGESAILTASEAGEWIKMMLVDSIRFLKIIEIDYVGIGVDPYILALKEELIDFVHFCSVSSK